MKFIIYIFRIPFEISVVPTKNQQPTSTQVSTSVSPTQRDEKGKQKAEERPSSSIPPPPPPAPKNVLFLKQRRGTIESFGQVVIEFTVHPQTPGRQTHTLCVRNLANSLDEYIVVTLSSRPRQYVYFPDLADSSLLEFGQCYIEKHKKYAKVVPLRMENQSHTEIHVSMKSNLAMQVFVFQDEKLTQPAENIHMLGYILCFSIYCMIP